MPKLWADKPFQLIQTPRFKLNGKKETAASAQATHMAPLHNYMLRVLNAIYLQAPYIKAPKDVSNFIDFVAAWSATLHKHHKLEEDLLFPLLGQQVGVHAIMDISVQQHEAFAPGLLSLDDYIAAVRSATESYDGQKVQAIINSFGTVLAQHLTEEIRMIEELDRYDQKINWTVIDTKVHKYAVQDADKNWAIPMAMTNFDLDYENGIHRGFSPFPWYIALIFRFIFLPKHSGAWRFSACDSYGKRRELPFAPVASETNTTP